MVDPLAPLVRLSLRRTDHRALTRARFGPLAPVMLAEGVTSARFDMLAALRGATRGSPLRQRDLGPHLGVSRSTVSRMLTSLVSLGLVRQEGDPKDGRQRLLTLTPRGQRWAEGARADAA